MKKMSKLSIAFLVILTIIAMATTLSFAVEGTVDINSILGTEEDSSSSNNDSESTDTSKIEDIEEETSQDGQGSSSDGNNSSEDGSSSGSISSGDTSSGSNITGSSSSNSGSQNGSSTKNSDTVKTVTDDSKLPQTGQAENILIILPVVIFGILAVIAYKKIKKYSVK